MILFLGFVLNTAYTTYLTSIMSTNNYREAYEDSEDLHEANLKLYIAPNTKTYFENNYTDAKTKLIRHKLIECHDPDTCLGDMAYKGIAAFCMPRIHKDYILDKYVTTNNVRLINCFRKIYVEYPIVLMVKIGFPLFGRLDAKLKQISQTGLIMKWRQDLHYSKNESVKEGDEEDDAFYFEMQSQILEFSDLKPLFLLLGQGYLVCLVIFILELIYFYWIEVSTIHIEEN